MKDLHLFRPLNFVTKPSVVTRADQDGGRRKRVRATSQSTENVKRKGFWKATYRDS